MSIFRIIIPGGEKDNNSDSKTKILVCKTKREAFMKWFLICRDKSKPGDTIIMNCSNTDIERRKSGGGYIAVGRGIPCSNTEVHTDSLLCVVDSTVKNIFKNIDSSVRSVEIQRAVLREALTLNILRSLSDPEETYRNKNYCVCVNTYNRPDKLREIVEALTNIECTLYIKVFDDGSTKDYSDVIYEYPEMEFIRFKHRGKYGFWETFHYMFQHLKKDIEFDGYFFLQDDMITDTSSINNVLALVNSLPINKNIVINPVANMVKFDVDMWGALRNNFKYEIHAGIRVIKNGFIDCKFFCTRDILEDLDWSMDSISLNRWRKNKNLGSGVGQQLTARIMENGPIYLVFRSGFGFPVDDKSFMNPTERSINVPICRINNSFGYKRVAGMASIPGRQEDLKRVVESIVNNVDELHIILNGYRKVPKFLTDPRITVYRSQKIGDFTDAGKFYPLAIKDFGKCMYFTCDDDIIYPELYFDYMEMKALKYKCPITMHGRVLPNKRDAGAGGIKYYRQTTLVKHFRKHLSTYVDTVCDFGGTGVMVMPLDTGIKIKDMKMFKKKCSADIWIGLKMRNEGRKIMCVDSSFGIKFELTDQTDSIFSTYRGPDITINNID